MSQAKSKAASGGPGAAARADTAAKSLDFHGLNLKLPPKLPFNMLRHVRGDVGGAEVVGLIEELIGPKQLEQVWNLNLDVEEGLALLRDITDAYGVTPGKSTASPKS